MIHTDQPPFFFMPKGCWAYQPNLRLLLFEEDERGPDERGPDERLKLQFEAVTKLDAHEREAVETVIASILHMHDAKRWTQPAASSEKTAKKAAGKR